MTEPVNPCPVCGGELTHGHHYPGATGHPAESDAPLTERALLALDHLLHRTLDGYINRTLPGWGHLQLWQWHVCNAYESRYDRRVTPPDDGDAP